MALSNGLTERTDNGSSVGPRLQEDVGEGVQLLKLVVLNYISGPVSGVMFRAMDPTWNKNSVPTLH